jgi:nucleoside-diphosphate-sugar epimerase
MRAVVLGGTGFLGAHAVRALQAAGHHVTVVTRRPYLVPPGVADAVGLGEPVRECLAGIFAELRPDVVVNAVGEIWAPSAGAQASANVDFPTRLLVALAGRGARLVHLGSSLEYAPVDPPAALHEDSPVAASSTYARTKLTSTRRVLQSADDLGLDVVVLRVFNAIGAGVSPASLLGRVSAELLRAHRAGDVARLQVLKTPAYRDYVDVGDVAGAVVAAAEADLAGGHLVNIGSGVATSAEDLVRGLAEHTGIAHRVDKAPATTRADGAWQRADTRRAADLLCWAPTTPLPSTLAAVWAAVAHPLGAGPASARPSTRTEGGSR